MPIIILSSWKSVQVLTKTYVIALISIGLLSTASFIVIDLLLFYISFEAVLIPMYLILSIYGSRNRKMHAANMLFLYTLFGSLFMLLGIILLYLETGTTNYEILMSVPIAPAKQLILWLAFFIAFATKIPMIPVHIWLPEAHVEASTAASVI